MTSSTGRHTWNATKKINKDSQFIGTCNDYSTNYCDVMMGAMASQITSITIVYSIVYSDVYQRKHHTSASLAFVRGIHRGQVNYPHKWPAARKMFPFDDVIMHHAPPQSLRPVHPTKSWVIHRVRLTDRSPQPCSTSSPPWNISKFSRRLLVWPW